MFLFRRSVTPDVSSTGPETRVLRQPYDWNRFGQLTTYCLLLLAAYQASQLLASHARSELARLEQPESMRTIRLIRRHLEQGIDLAQDLVVVGAGTADRDMLPVLNDLRRANRRALDSLENASPGRSASLREHMERLWETIGDLMQMPDSERRKSARDLWDTRIVRLRDAIQSSLRDLSDADQGARRRLASQNYFELQRQLRVILWILIAAFTNQFFWNRKSIRDARRREQDRIREIEHLARTQDELKLLSAKLLTLQEDERKSLSRELHDGLGQLLTAVRMEIAAIRSSIAASDGTRLEARIERAHIYNAEAIKVVRTITSLLRPSVLDNIGLEAALQAHVDDFSQRTGIHCALAIQSPRNQLPDSWKTCAYRIVQEALHNCEKHARATLVQISMIQEPATLSVNIEDNGQGFVYDESRPRIAGLGLLGMRERAVMLGGTLTIETGPGCGTKVQLRLPVAEMSVLKIDTDAYAALNEPSVNKDYASR